MITELQKQILKSIKFYDLLNKKAKEWSAIELFDRGAASNIGSITKSLSSLSEQNLVERIEPKFKKQRPKFRITDKGNKLLNEDSYGS